MEQDYSELDDPAFLAERARVRDLLEHAPEQSVARAYLGRVFAALDEEFDRRARAAWARASQTAG